MTVRSDFLKKQVAELTRKGLSGKDIAAELKVTRGRVSQILTEHKAKHGERGLKPLLPVLSTIAGADETVSDQTLDDLHDQLREQVTRISDEEIPNAGTSRERKQWTDALARLSEQLRKVAESRIVYRDSIRRERDYQQLKKIILEEIGYESKAVQERIFRRLEQRHITGLDKLDGDSIQHQKDEGEKGNT